MGTTAYLNVIWQQTKLVKKKKIVKKKKKKTFIENSFIENSM